MSAEFDVIVKSFHQCERYGRVVWVPADTPSLPEYSVTQLAKGAKIETGMRLAARLA